MGIHQIPLHFIEMDRMMDAYLFSPTGGKNVCREKPDKRRRKICLEPGTLPGKTLTLPISKSLVGSLINIVQNDSLSRQ
jgi:hypothetical protein